MLGSRIVSFMLRVHTNYAKYRHSTFDKSNAHSPPSRKNDAVSPENEMCENQPRMEDSATERVRVSTRKNGALSRQLYARKEYSHGNNIIARATTRDTNISVCLPYYRAHFCAQCLRGSNFEHFVNAMFIAASHLVQAAWRTQWPASQQHPPHAMRIHSRASIVWYVEYSVIAPRRRSRSARFIAAPLLSKLCQQFNAKPTRHIASAKTVPKRRTDVSFQVYGHSSKQSSVSSVVNDGSGGGGDGGNVLTSTKTPSTPPSEVAYTLHKHSQHISNRSVLPVAICLLFGFPFFFHRLCVLLSDVCYAASCFSRTKLCRQRCRRRLHQSSHVLLSNVANVRSCVRLPNMYMCQNDIRCEVCGTGWRCVVRLLYQEKDGATTFLAPRR